MGKLAGLYLLQDNRSGSSGPHDQNPAFAHLAVPLKQGAVYTVGQPYKPLTACQYNKTDGKITSGYIKLEHCHARYLAEACQHTGEHNVARFPDSGYAPHRGIHAEYIENHKRNKRIRYRIFDRRHSVIFRYGLKPHIKSHPQSHETAELDYAYVDQKQNHHSEFFISRHHLFKHFIIPATFLIILVLFWISNFEAFPAHLCTSPGRLLKAPT